MEIITLVLSLFIGIIVFIGLNLLTKNISKDDAYKNTKDKIFLEKIDKNVYEDQNKLQSELEVKNLNSSYESEKKDDSVKQFDIKEDEEREKLRKEIEQIEQEEKNRIKKEREEIRKSQEQNKEVQHLNTDSDEVVCPVVKAIYEYKEKSERNLYINVGDEIAVVQKADKWYRGRNLSTNHFGWFPSNYVTETGKTFSTIIIPETEEQTQEQTQDSECSKEVKLDTTKIQPKIAQLREELLNQAGNEIFKEQ